MKVALTSTLEAISSMPVEILSYANYILRSKMHDELSRYLHAAVDFSASMQWNIFIIRYDGTVMEPCVPLFQQGREGLSLSLT